jgi:F-type H+/Na+-transporting ATPase subunit alpha
MTREDLHSQLFAPLEDALAQVRPAIETAEIARILSVSNGVAEVAGFTDLRADELLAFPDGVMGIASNLGVDRAGVIVLGETERLRPGDPVRRTGRVVDVPVGAALLGRVVDALGRPLDAGRPIDAERFLPVERPAPPIMHRAPVQVPCRPGSRPSMPPFPSGAASAS